MTGPNGATRRSAHPREFELDRPGDRFANQRFDIGLDLGTERGQGVLQMGFEPSAQRFLEDVRDVRADCVENALS